MVEDAGPKGALVHHYFHNDDQNTIGLVTDDSFNFATGAGIPQNELSDVFGQPRLSTGAIDPAWGANDVSRRRWINQEDLADAHLIDLNARLYDPLLAKFVSPDPMIANQDDSQSWNAYAYAHNNPMSKEDPTGLWTVGCYCQGSGQQIAAEADEITADAVNLANIDPPSAATVQPGPPATQQQKSVTRGAQMAQAGAVASDVVTSLAKGAAIGNPITGGLIIAGSMIGSTASNDTTQGCGGPCDMLGVHKNEVPAGARAGGDSGGKTGATPGDQGKSPNINPAAGGKGAASAPSSIIPRPDLPALSGGRSGQRVPGLTGPPSSAIHGADGRIYITDDKGKVVVDVTRDRAKPVTPGGRFGPKRPSTPEEQGLLDQMGK